MIRAIVLLGALLSIALALPQHNDEYLKVSKRQNKYDKISTDDRAQAVIDTFRISWDGYSKFAFPNDELKPVTNGFSNSRNAWGASAVDALSTALVMRQKDIVNKIIEYIPTVNYYNTSTEVSLFETTIRYLGGMISGYDFLNGPLADLADKKENVDALLEQSVNLANALSYAFDTPSGVPHNSLTFTDRGATGDTNGLATVGTLIMEWTRLADLTGNKTYANLVNAAENHLIQPKPASSEPWPGLVGTNINIATGQFVDARGGWTGGTDSFYEYLIKMFVYDPKRYSVLKDRWVLAADSTIAHLTSHPAPRPDLTFVATYNGQKLNLISQHLAGFAGGNFILAGQVLGRQDYIDYGLKLADSWHATYTQTATHIGPETFGWNSSEVPADQKAFFDKSGFYIRSSDYVLRPEVIESFYYAYRATGDTKYQDWVWDAFLAVNATTRVGSGYSSIRNVNAADGGGFTDFQESFWFAEVLKYCYLIFAPEEEWDVSKDGKNKWVFNTEAHPFKVFGS